MLFEWFFVSFLLTTDRFVAGTNSNNVTKPVTDMSNVGYFKISIEDNQLPDHQTNDTLWKALQGLYNAYNNLWEDSDVFPPGQEAVNITMVANKYAIQANNIDSANIIYNLLTTANESLNNDKEYLMNHGCKDYLTTYFCYPDDSNQTSFNATSAQDYMDEWSWDLGLEYLLAVRNATFLTELFNQAAYMGLGQTVSCSDNINTVMESKSEWAKLTSGMASTIMAILPTLLAFGTFYVPRSSEVFATSTLVGLGSAVFSLGIPVKSMTAIPEGQTLSLAGLGFAALVTITSYGTLCKATEKYQKEIIPDSKLEVLREWSNPDSSDILQNYHQISIMEAKHRFSGIRKSVEHWELRRHWWIVPAIIFTAVQATIFGVAIAPLLGSRGAPRFIYSCRNTTWTTYYLAISAVANAIFRLIMWETGYHERVKLYHLSAAAQRELSYFVSREGDRAQSVDNELPPLYPPWLELFLTKRDIILHRVGYDTFWNLIGFGRYSMKDHKPRAGLREIIRMILAHGKMAHFRSYFTAVPAMIRSGFTPGGRVEAMQNFSACRWRPLIVLIHQNVEGRNKLKTFLMGFMESMLLLFLTFFFAAQWAGNLNITLFALVMLVIFISVGRLVGFMYVVLSAKFWGLHVIDCKSQEEILGSLRIICAMEDVLVVVNGASYFNGYRIEGLKGYELWRTAYEKGEFDLVVKHEGESSRDDSTGGEKSLKSGGIAKIRTIHAYDGEASV